MNKDKLVEDMLDVYFGDPRWRELTEAAERMRPSMSASLAVAEAAFARREASAHEAMFRALAHEGIPGPVRERIMAAIRARDDTDAT